MYVCAKLGIADQLGDGPRRGAELAITAGADAGALHRLRRALASVGVLAETDAGQFALTSLGALLRSGTPDSLRALAILYGEEQKSTETVAILRKSSRTPVKLIHKAEPT